MTILEMETLAASAWPSHVVAPLDGWRLRFMDGVTSRANSVWPNGRSHSISPLPLSTKISRAEAFYAAHGAPSRFQISPASQPAALTSQLSARGYTPSPPTHVMRVPLGQISLPNPHAAEVEGRITLPSDWYGATPSRVEQIRLENMARIQPLTYFVRLWHQGACVTQGYGVLERGWLGVYSLETLPEFRRQGWGTAVLAHLGRWAEAQQAHTLYLQVYSENKAAISLYRKVGFKFRYSYRYWEK